MDTNGNSGSGLARIRIESNRHRGFAPCVRQTWSRKTAASDRCCSTTKHQLAICTGTHPFHGAICCYQFVSARIRVKPEPLFPIRPRLLDTNGNSGSCLTRIRTDSNRHRGFAPCVRQAWSRKTAASDRCCLTTKHELAICTGTHPFHGAICCYQFVSARIRVKLEPLFPLLPCLPDTNGNSGSCLTRIPTDSNRHRGFAPCVRQTWSRKTAASDRCCLTTKHQLAICTGTHPSHGIDLLLPVRISSYPCQAGTVVSPSSVPPGYERKQRFMPDTDTNREQQTPWIRSMCSSSMVARDRGVGSLLFNNKTRARDLHRHPSISRGDLLLPVRISSYPCQAGTVVSHSSVPSGYERKQRFLPDTDTNREQQTPGIRSVCSSSMVARDRGVGSLLFNNKTPARELHRHPSISRGDLLLPVRISSYPCQAGTVVSHSSVPPGYERKQRFLPDTDTNR